VTEFTLRLHDLVEDQVQLWIHGSPGSLEAREVLMWRIGGQNRTKSNTDC
jgi:hypothetical protein